MSNSQPDDPPTAAQLPSERCCSVDVAVWEKDYAAYSSEAADRLKFQVEFAQSALKNFLIVNGGAVLALLTALGNSSMHHDSRGLFWAFVWFGTGLSLSLAAYFGAFYSQFYFYNASLYQAWIAQAQAHELEHGHDAMPDFKRGNRALKCGLGAAISSLAAFMIGAFVALDAIL